MTERVTWKLGLLFTLLGIFGCSDSSDSPPPEEEQPSVGYEIMEIQGPNSIRTWASNELTQEEFDAIELPGGWFKNQPREVGPDVNGPDSMRFLRSPDGVEDGDYLEAEHFDYPWLHVATIIERDGPIDEEGLLRGTTVRKYHEVTYNAGSTMVLLISPEGRVYFRIGRDANRVSDEPSIPNLWRLEEYTTPEKLVIELFEENLVIRTDNQDAFQGPVPELEGVL